MFQNFLNVISMRIRYLFRFSCCQVGIITDISPPPRLEGFIVMDYTPEFPAARAQLAKWLSEGKLQRKETIIKGGLGQAEYAINQLFKGKNIGTSVQLQWVCRFRKRELISNTQQERLCSR